MVSVLEIYPHTQHSDIQLSWLPAGQLAAHWGEDENDNLTVTGCDDKHDTVTSQVRIDSEVAVEQTVILSWRQHSLVRPQPQYEHLHPRLPPGLRDGGALQVRGVRV